MSKRTGGRTTDLSVVEHHMNTSHNKSDQLAGAHLSARRDSFSEHASNNIDSFCFIDYSQTDFNK